MRPMLAAFFVLCQILPLDAISIQPSWRLGDQTGSRCSRQADCAASNSRCVDNRCHCLSTQLLLRRSCVPKLKVGASGCVADAQCSGEWAGARCVNRICQCRDGQATVRTRDGVVCFGASGECALGGSAAVLRDASGVPATCFVNERSGYVSGCLGQLHMYDCIRDSSRGMFYCCPNRANVCGQSKNAGVFQQVQLAEPLQRITSDLSKLPWYLQHSRYRHHADVVHRRWHFDRVSGLCSAFNYNGAAGNGNNFGTKSHCESYCRTSCVRGSAMFQKGPDGKVVQYVQRQQTCDLRRGCGDPQFDCHLIQPGRALCCPNREFLCSEFGGVPQRHADTYYDSGLHCTNISETVVRYYYNRFERACLPFTFKGCAGNHNNFDTRASCEQYCIFDRVLLDAQGNGTTNGDKRLLWPTNRATFG